MSFNFIYGRCKLKSIRLFWRVFFFCRYISFWQKFTFFNPKILHYGLPLIFRCSRVHFGSQVASCWYLRAQKTRTQIVHGKIKKISGKPWPRNFGQKNRFHIVKTPFILTVTTKSNLHPPPSTPLPILLPFFFFYAHESSVLWSETLQINNTFGYVVFTYWMGNCIFVFQKPSKILS